MNFKRRKCKGSLALRLYKGRRQTNLPLAEVYQVWELTKPITWLVSTNVSSLHHKPGPLPLSLLDMVDATVPIRTLTGVPTLFRQYGWGGVCAAFCVLRHVLLSEKPVWCIKSSKAAWQMWCNHVTTMKSEPLFKPFAKSHLQSHSSVYTITKQSNLHGELEVLWNLMRGSLCSQLSFSVVFVI